MATVVVRVRGLSSGTLNHIAALSEDIWIEWPAEGDIDSCPQIVGTFAKVDDGFVVLKWKQADGGAKGRVAIPMDKVEAIITVKCGKEDEGSEDDESEEDEEGREEAGLEEEESGKKGK
ncbi:MAG TPA: hypothetical protein DEP45_12465 [Armatimonadetes bacterium]|nr:hypothetical protein [Armatimonadota bacterium]